MNDGDGWSWLLSWTALHLFICTRERIVSDKAILSFCSASRNVQTYKTGMRQFTQSYYFNLCVIPKVFQEKKNTHTNAHHWWNELTLPLSYSNHLPANWVNASSGFSQLSSLVKQPLHLWCNVCCTKQASTAKSDFTKCASTPHTSPQVLMKCLGKEFYLNLTGKIYCMSQLCLIELAHELLSFSISYQINFFYS